VEEGWKRAVKLLKDNEDDLHKVSSHAIEFEIMVLTLRHSHSSPAHS
jgi:hypothetical protein